MDKVCGNEYQESETDDESAKTLRELRKRLMAIFTWCMRRKKHHSKQKSAASTYMHGSDKAAKLSQGSQIITSSRNRSAGSKLETSRLKAERSLNSPPINRPLHATRAWRRSENRRQRTGRPRDGTCSRQDLNQASILKPSFVRY